MGADGRLRKQEKEYGSRVTLRIFLRLSQFTDSVLLHISDNQRRRGMTVPRKPFIGTGVDIPVGDR